MSSLTDVLGFNIGVYKVAFVMQVLKAKQHLSADNLDQIAGDALSLIAFDKREQILPKWLKDNADVRFLGTLMVKRVEKGDDKVTAWVLWTSSHDLA